jgi:lipopolysaccharide export system permease protein
MRTVRRFIYRDVLVAITFVAVAFLALFFFIDVVDELERIGRGGYTVRAALLYCALLLPGHLYELMPIAVLIGTIYAMARLAQSSEFTILRTSGLGPGAALGLLLVLGLGCAAVTFVVGDYVAPWADRQAEWVRVLNREGKVFGRPGTWLKDRGMVDGAEHTYSVQVTTASAEGDIRDIRLYEFDPRGRLVARIIADRGRIGDDGVWVLEDARRTRVLPGGVVEGRDELEVQDDLLPRFEWASSLSSTVVAAAVRPPDTMSAMDLFRYMSHLADNEQAAQRYEIQFWKKAFYPFACLVMVALALPFAYLHSRSGGISLKVFGGVMLGISFVLLNNIASHIGLLQNWTPWVAAATPSACYLLISLLAFQWLVRYR